MGDGDLLSLRSMPRLSGEELQNSNSFGKKKKNRKVTQPIMIPLEPLEPTATPLVVISDGGQNLGCSGLL